MPWPHRAGEKGMSAEERLKSAEALLDRL